jgi:hypothetical protein
VPKLTAEQRAELEAQLAADDADDDDDFDFDYTEGDRSIRMPWSRRHALAELGFKHAPKPPAAKTDDSGKKPAARKPVFGARSPVS